MADQPDPIWSELAPGLREREELLVNLARQVRIQFLAGKSEDDVKDWLEQQGLSTQGAHDFLKLYPRGELRNHQHLLVQEGTDDDAIERRGDRLARRRKSQQLAEATPDESFAIADDSYAQVIAREARKASWVPLVFGGALFVIGLLTSIYLFR